MQVSNFTDQLHNSNYLTYSSNAKLISLADKIEWLDYLNKLPHRMQDAYYTPEYYDIWEKNGNGNALCFVYEDGDRLALHPFLLNRINELGYELDDSYYDIQGAYGYNGVVYSSDDLDFRKNFHNEFDKFCKSTNIIAGFTRFNPLLENFKFSINFLDIIFNRKTVYVDLNQKYIDISKNYSRSAKQNLHTALSNNLTMVIHTSNFPYKREFIEMYKETMDRVNAERYLYFNDEYFNNTFNNLKLIQFVVLKDTTPIASSLCLASGIYLHIHFKASKQSYSSFRPNSFLFDAIVKYGVEKEFKKLHIGGGKNPSLNDSLLRFKKKFSNTTSDFYIGKKIYNPEIFNQVYEQWSKRYPHLVEKYKERVLAYRYCE